MHLDCRCVGVCVWGVGVVGGGGCVGWGSSNKNASRDESVETGDESVEAGDEYIEAGEKHNNHVIMVNQLFKLYCHSTLHTSWERDIIFC